MGIRGTSKVTVLGKVTGSGAAHRIAIDVYKRQTYRFSSLGNLVSDFTTLGAKVYQTLTAGNNAGNGGADAVNSYRSQESYYNTFVYQEDTALPASLKTLFQKELGDEMCIRDRYCWWRI